MSGYYPQQPPNYPGQQQPGYNPAYPQVNQQPGAPPPQGYPQPGQAPGYPPQNPAYGAPPGQPPYGAPHHPYPGQAPQYGQPTAPPQYGQAPPQQAPSAPYGQAPQPQQYGQAPPQQYGQAPPQASAPFGAEPAYFADNVPVGVPSAPGGWARKPSPKVSLSLTATNLSDKDITSKSDPMAVFFLHDVATQKWYEAGRTEAMRDNLNPDWQDDIVVDYFFEEKQKFRVEVYDKDSSSSKLKKHDFLGKCEGTIAEIIAAKHGKKTFQLVDMYKRQMTGRGKKSQLTITAEQQSSNSEIYHLQFSGSKLDDKDFFGKSDPYMEIARQNADGTWNAVHRTEVIMNNLNPKWRQFEITSNTLCNSDRDRKLRCRIMDYDNDGSHDLIGDIYTTVNELNEAYRNSKTLPVINEKKKKKKGAKYKNSGVVSINHFKASKHYSFLDYIGTGTQLNFVVAIDYTASNGHPQDPRSLHYFDPTTQNNQYTDAIRAVGDIVQEYDSDKLFPALGFGAQLPDGQTSFCFNVNMTHDANCRGIDGVLYAYRSTLPQLRLYGPTNFAPVIRQAASQAVHQNGEAYQVLLIITDGAITDMAETQHEIVQASRLPMSIIIIGVGQADFSAMDELDCDGQLMKSPLNGQRAERDIVQFVPLRKFRSHGPSDFGNSRLAKEVLQEVPAQLEKWMRSRGVVPLG